MQNLAWYKNRLRRMSIREAWYRAVKLAGGLMSLLLPNGNAPAPRFPSEAAGNRPWITVPQGLDAVPYTRAAGTILSGHYRIFDLDAVELGRPPQWNRDPLSSITAPLTHATLLDYRDERTVGNIKYLWEPNRHLHLVTLAQAWALTANPVYATELRQQLESWIEQCPYPRGPNWSSSLELSIRLINWSISWQLLGGRESPIFSDTSGRRFMDNWLKSIFLHVRHIMRNLSQYSSANNHLIGEAAGVFIAGMTWPCWPRVDEWLERSREILIRETFKQNAADGGNREQAISYQQFVLDFLLIAGLAARAGGRDFPMDYWRRLEAMTDFLASMMDVGGNLPMIGDADDGFVVRLSPAEDFCPYQSLIATGAVLFNRPDLASKAQAFDAKSAWLLAGEEGEPAFKALLGKSAGAYSPRRTFPNSGYFVLGSDFETPEEVRLIVDAGPLGYLSLAAHGHADALAVVLSVGGEEVIVDPGTFCYHTQPEWRRFFRGTSAHNTVSVDGKDQSVQLGNFMWADHAEAECHEFRPNEVPQRFAGSHNGYRRLPDGVCHRREICYDAARREFEILDSLSCKGTHEVTRHWHFAEHLAPEVRDDGACSVRTRSGLAILAPLESIHGHRLLNGSLDPVGGWVSRRFGLKVASFTLHWTNKIEGKAVLRTRIAIRCDRKNAAE